jgi:hypothetical protein
MDNPKQESLGKFWEDIKKTGDSWHEIKKERPWKAEEIRDFSSTDLYTMEMMLEGYDTHNHVPLIRTINIPY